MADNLASEVSTQRALHRMAEVLVGMTRDMSNVAEMVSDLSTDRDAPLDPTQISQLQSLDRLNQSLRDLSIISRALADGTLNPSQHVPHLQLAETRAILNPMDAVEGPVPPGAIDLF